MRVRYGSSVGLVGPRLDRPLGNRARDRFPARPPALTLFGRRVVNAPLLGGSEIAACQKRFGGNRAQNGAGVPVLERVMRGSW